MFFRYLALFIIVIQYNYAQAQIESQSISATVFQELETKKYLIRIGDEKAVQNYKLLIQKADSLLTITPFSVINKSGVPSSKNKHDYMSIGPYWWPNPDTPDGLPYVRKDGKINPETRDNFTDYVEKKSFFSTITELTKAYYLSNKRKYAQKSIALINAWFLDDKTKMNPNVNYGQYIPGKSLGRCFGIIEFSGLNEITNFLQLAKARNSLDKKTEQGMFHWFTEYAHWLQKSDLGKEASTRENNHGTHYDLQLLNILLYLNKKEAVKEHLSTVSKARIFSQIEPDGKQPHELARTTSFSYATMNLHAFLELVRIGKKVGINLWEFESKDGRSIKKGYLFLSPFLNKEKKWPYQQIKSTASSERKLTQDLKYISTYLKDATFDKALEQQQNKKH